MINVQTKFWDLVFNNEPLKFLGRISYGTYIFHWPLYLIINPSLQQWAGRHMAGNSPQFFASIVATLLSYTLGYLSYRYFEMRFLKLKKHFA